MKNIVFAISVILLGFVLAEDVPNTQKQEQENSDRRETMLRRTGGMVYSVGKGKVVVVNCQNTISADTIRERVEKTAFVLKYNCELRDGQWNLNAQTPDDATVAIYLVDDEALPMSLVAVEARWGVVNTRNLKLGNRFAKELTRVITLVAGAALSPAKTSVMKTVTQPADLDTLLSDGFTQDMAMAIFANMEKLGATQSRPTSYLRACREGWASAPTNEYQKVIWEQVKAEMDTKPTKPLKIEKSSK